MKRCTVVLSLILSAACSGAKASSSAIAGTGTSSAGTSTLGAVSSTAPTRMTGKS